MSKKKRRHRLGSQSSQNVALGRRELIVRTLAQEPHAQLRLNAAGVEKMSEVLLGLPGRSWTAWRTRREKGNRRLFMDLEVTEIAGRLHINVVSTDLDR